MTIAVVDAKPFADAIGAALTAQGLTHAEGIKPSGVTTQPYVVWWLDGGNVVDSSLRGRDGWSLTVVLQCYGLSPDAVWFAVRKGRAAMLGLAGATVAGRHVALPSHEVPPPMQGDPKADPPIFWLPDEWRLSTSVA